MSLALQADSNKALSGFGKAVTVMLVFLSAAVERGASEAEIAATLDVLKAAVFETAARHIAETSQHAIDH